MALSVVGAGYGRTGTASLKLALEQLGFGPCHHMSKVRGRPGRLEHREAAAAGGAVDWNAVLAGFRRINSTDGFRDRNRGARGPSPLLRHPIRQLRPN